MQGQTAQAERKPFIELHNRETATQEKELIRLDGLVGELLEEIGAMLPLTGEGCPLDGSLPCDPENESVVYDGQLRTQLLNIRSNTTTIEKLQNGVSTALVNLRMIHNQLAGVRLPDPVEPERPAFTYSSSSA
jgi:hypothetical protein